MQAEAERAVVIRLKQMVQAVLVVAGQAHLTELALLERQIQVVEVVAVVGIFWGQTQAAQAAPV